MNLHFLLSAFSLVFNVCRFCNKMSMFSMLASSFLFLHNMLINLVAVANSGASEFLESIKDSAASID